MPLRLSKGQAKQYGIAPKVKKPSPRERFGGYASSWEREYAAYLDRQKHQGQIQRWQYEAVSLNLAPKTKYTPDFCVVNRQGIIEFHEVKGLFREAAKVRFRLAVHLFPQFRFFIVRLANKQWDIEAF